MDTSADGVTSDEIKEKLADVQSRADELENRLDHEDLSQMQMNETSGDLYKLWDDEINEIWKYLKATLSDADMQKLTDEQIKWINEKEARIEEEGKEYEGGSIRPLIENRLGAQLTKDRVYELIEYVE